VPCIISYLATHNPNRYLDTIEDTFTQLPDLQELQGANRAAQEALQIRDSFMRYLIQLEQYLGRTDVFRDKKCITGKNQKYTFVFHLE
jgi:hypothetical protein